MNFAEKAFQQTWRRLVLIQVSLVAVAAVIAFLKKGDIFTWALLYGGAVSIVSTLIHVWRIRIATETAAENNALAMAELLKGWAMRIVAVITLLAAAFAVFKLNALAVISGFIVAHFGYLLARPVGTAKRRIG